MARLRLARQNKLCGSSLILYDDSVFVNLFERAPGRFIDRAGETTESGNVELLWLDRGTVEITVENGHDQIMD